MYFDLYPLEMIKKQNKTKIKQKTLTCEQLFISPITLTETTTILIYTYRLNTYQTSVSVFHLTISLDILHNGMTLVNH